MCSPLCTVEYCSLHKVCGYKPWGRKELSSWERKYQRWKIKKVIPWEQGLWWDTVSILWTRTFSSRLWNSRFWGGAWGVWGLGMVEIPVEYKVRWSTLWSSDPCSLEISRNSWKVSRPHLEIGGGGKSHKVTSRKVQRWFSIACLWVLTLGCFYSLNTKY